VAILARSTGRRRSRRALSEINVVPYIDVMLVLVVILMVSAPFVNPSLVELPSIGKAARAPDAPLEVIVFADGKLQLRDHAAATKPSDVDLAILLARIKAKQREAPDTPVVISGDKNARYEHIARVMDALYKENIRKVGLSVKTADS